MRSIRPAIVAIAALLVAAHADAAPRRVATGVEFSYSNPGASSVFWAGEFSGWNATANPMTKDGQGIWRIVMPLPAGEHQYKLVIDGQWFADPDNPVTGGEFGNSVVTVGVDGELVAMQATSNTPYSPKIFFGGRIIGLFIATDDEDRDRFELRRPNMDINLDMSIRIATMLSARFLMDINSETENVEFFRSSLNFNRGNLHFNEKELEIFAYDNEDAGTWDDPLKLVGNVGIYDYPYGFGRQGFQARPNYWGFQNEAHYADNFNPGGTTFPGLPDEALDAAIMGLPVDSTGAGYVLRPSGFNLVRNVNVSDDNEDMFALRSKRSLIAGLTLGLLGRADRGFDLSTLRLAETVDDTSLTLLSGDFEGEWFAAGGEAAWKLPLGLDVYGEFLRGTKRLTGVNASTFAYTLQAADTSGPTSYQLQSADPANGKHRTIDDSNRLRFGAHWQPSHGDITLRASVEYEDHAYSFIQDDIKNSMTILRGGWDRNWRYYLNRELKTSIDVEYFAFDYDPRTPWNYQLWFPTGNFWLEHRAHKVSYDKMTMLGVADVYSFKPRVEIPLYRPRNVMLQFQGTYNLASLTTIPKYAESVFQFGVDLTPNMRLSTDHRWAKYDDPNLGLFSGYLNNFYDLTYTFATDLSISFSWGVDPYVLDLFPNEYRYIGRDAFLFGRGATGSRAETNYFSLGTFNGVPGVIDLAESALERERRVQIEAIVRF